MKLLVTGRGGAGSWTVRGEQIGAAMGALVRPHATGADIQSADSVLVVKRVPEALLQALRRCGRPWAYDIVDSYPQPVCSTWSRKQAIAWVREYLRRLKPTAVVWPNARMRDDCGEGEVIYHHHRPGLERNPIRPMLKTIGYEGRAQYLEGWHKTIDRECERRGLRFLLNPPRLADLDVVLAVRGGAWRGYVPDHWKSNVKLANAHASGTPFIGIKEQGYVETGTGAEEWVDQPSDLGPALDRLTDQATRMAVHETFLAATFPLEYAAKQFRGVLCALRS